MGDSSYFTFSCSHGDPDRHLVSHLSSAQLIINRLRVGHSPLAAGHVSRSNDPLLSLIITRAPIIARPSDQAGLCYVSMGHFLLGKC